MSKAYKSFENVEGKYIMLLLSHYLTWLLIHAKLKRVTNFNHGKLIHRELVKWSNKGEKRESEGIKLEYQKKLTEFGFNIHQVIHVVLKRFV